MDFRSRSTLYPFTLGYLPRRTGT